jgi:hypothetical protein
MSRSRLCFVLATAVTACGGNPQPVTTPPQPVTTPPQVSSTPQQATGPSIQGIWVPRSQGLPFSFLKLDRWIGPNATAWCATTDGGALGSRVAAVDEGALTLAVWLRPGGAAGAPPAAPTDAPCPQAFPPVTQGDGVLPTTAPDVLRCTWRDGRLHCVTSGGDLEMLDVAGQLDPMLRIAFDETPPNVTWEGALVCRGGCPQPSSSDLANHFVRLIGAPLSLGDGESMLHIQGSKGSVLSVLATNANLYFEIGQPLQPEGKR